MKNSLKSKFFEFFKSFESKLTNDFYTFSCKLKLLLIPCSPKTCVIPMRKTVTITKPNLLILGQL